jgi:hypothetical protein
MDLHPDIPKAAQHVRLYTGTTLEYWKKKA